MRAGLLVLLLAACGPKVASAPHIVENDLDLPPPGAMRTDGSPTANEPQARTDSSPSVADAPSGTRTGQTAPAQPSPAPPAQPSPAPPAQPPAPAHLPATPPARATAPTWPPASAAVETTGELPDYQRIVAPPGKGLRTGTIARDQLLTILNAGPGNFLRQLEVAPRLSGNRFVGWQLVQLLDHAGPLGGLDLLSGDVLLAINGNPLSRPEQLQTMWDSLRTANEVTAHLWRGDKKFDLRFKIEPAVR